MGLRAPGRRRRLARTLRRDDLEQPPATETSRAAAKGKRQTKKPAAEQGDTKD